MNKQIITYQFAYIPGTIDLCQRCEAIADGLGAVSHGYHSGECDLCGPADRWVFDLTTGVWHERTGHG